MTLQTGRRSAMAFQPTLAALRRKPAFQTAGKGCAADLLSTRNSAAFLLLAGVLTGITCGAQPNLTSPAGRGLSSLLKPGFHITPEYGWQNDPNAPHLGPDGAIHLFFQWNPKAPKWGPPYWAHCVTYDWAHWQRLPVALIPDTPYDYDGVFSGSATVQPNGQPLILYTAVSNFSSNNFYYQTQAMAVPANASDLTFQRWIKSPVDMQLPPGGTPAQFRDPITAWRANDTWYTVVGTQVDCIGSASLYSSPDLLSWSLRGTLSSQVGLALGRNRLDPRTCEPPEQPEPGMGACRQQGADCRMWECPDYFEVDGAYVIKWSDQVTGRTPYAADWYVVSDLVPDLSDQGGVSSAAGIFEPSFNGQPSVARRLDFGSIYASKSFDANGRRLWVGWAYETAAGCSKTCSDGTPLFNELGWQGAQTLLREVSLDSDTGALLMNPLPELADLRSAVLFDGSVSDLQPAADVKHNDCELFCGSDRQLEVAANFSLPSSSAGPFNCGIALSAGNASRTVIGISGALQAAEGGELLITQATVYVDRAASGPLTNTTLEGGDLPLPAAGLVHQAVDLVVFIDRSIIEVYALGGRGRVTSRIYPQGEGDWGLSIFGVGATAEVKAWSLDDAFTESSISAR